MNDDMNEFKWWHLPVGILVCLAAIFLWFVLPASFGIAGWYLAGGTWKEAVGHSEIAMGVGFFVGIVCDAAICRMILGPENDLASLTTESPRARRIDRDRCSYCGQDRPISGPCRYCGAPRS
jgi:hypothetical protein